MRISTVQTNNSLASSVNQCSFDVHLDHLRELILLNWILLVPKNTYLNRFEGHYITPKSSGSSWNESA